MTDDNRRTQAQAVFFSLVMVLSMVGGTVALAGSAAAATTSVELSDSLVQEGDKIDVNGTVNSNGTVHAFIDQDGDGNYTSNNDKSGSVDIDDYEEDNEFSISLTAPTDSGAYDVYVFQDEGETGSTIDEDDEGERSAQLQVDADGPVFGNETPEADTDVTAEQDIVVPITDDEEGVDTGVASVRATVTSSTDEEVTFEIDPDTANADGVSFIDNELTISPGTGNVPSIGDGTYTVDLTATDDVGNQNTTSFEFGIDGTDPTVDFVTPGESTDFITSDENQTINVNFDAGSGRTLNDSTAELTIDGAGNYEETLNNSFNGYESDTGFLIDVDDDIPPLPEGDVTLTASVEDDIGNDVTESTTFEVDLTSPNVTNVELSDNEINITDRDVPPTATITFDEPVIAGSVTVDVNVDDGAPISIDSGQSYVEDENEADIESQVIVPLNQDNALDGKIENDSAVVNVTSAMDQATNDNPTANSLGNADADVSNTTFAIDTDGPTVELAEIPADLSGYVNVTSFIDSQSDVDSTAVAIEVGGQNGAGEYDTELPSDIDQDALVDITSNAENLTTQADAYPDGGHVLVVAVQDDAGNVAYAAKPFTLDNNEAVTISPAYLPGVVTPVPANGEVDLDNVFVGDSLEYEVSGGTVTDDNVLNADQNRGQTVTVTATGPGGDSTLPVEIEFEPLVGAESVSGDEINIGVAAGDTELGELNVTVSNTDDYFEDETQTLTIEDFSEFGDTGVYSATADGLRDGQYEVTIDDAEDVDESDVLGEVGLSGVNGGANMVSGVAVDNNAPSAETAYITDSDGDETTVRVEFTEPVETIEAADVTFDGSSDAVVDVNNGPNNGMLTVDLDGEVQTADAPLLNVSSDAVTEIFGDGTTLDDFENSEPASTEVATISLDLSADGLNVISLPAEAGSVDIEDTGLNTNEAGGEGGLVVYAYDEANNEFDESFSPGAEENTLTELEGGEGYIVTVEEDITAEFNVQNVPSEELQAGQSQQITEGYNLIGHYQEGQQSVGQALTYLETDYDIERGYSGTQVSALESGEGYWLFSNGAGVHAPVNYGGVASEQPQITDVQVTDATGDGTVQPDEEVEIVATVDHDSELAVEAGVGSISSTETVSLSKDSEGTYSGTVTADSVGKEMVRMAEAGEVSISVTATDADGNFGTSSVDVGTDAESKLVTNTVTGTQYSSLKAALSEVQAQETLELSEGTFVQNDENLRITTDDITLVGQGTEVTEIAADVTVEGDFVEIEGIAGVANSPTGSIVVNGDEATLNQVASEDIIEVNGASATVSESSASNEIIVNGTNTNVQDSSADIVSVGSGSSGASLNNVRATTSVTIDQSAEGTTITGDSSVPADTAVNTDTGEQFTGGSAIQDAIGDSNTDTDDTIRVGPGTYDESVTVDVEGLTLEGPNAGIDGDSSDRGAEATITGKVNIGGDPGGNPTLSGEVVIDGIEVTSTSGLADGVISVADRSERVENVTIKNSVIDIDSSDASAGIASEEVDNLSIENNKFTDSGSGTSVAYNVVQSPVNSIEMSENTLTGVDRLYNEARPGAFIPGRGIDSTTVSLVDNDVNRANLAIGISDSDDSLESVEYNISGNQIDVNSAGIAQNGGDPATFTIENNEFSGGSDTIYVDDSENGILDLNAILNDQGNTFDPAATDDGDQIVVE